MVEIARVLVAYPVSKWDHHLAVAGSRWIRELGGVKNYRVCCVWDGELSLEEREPILAEFREAFGKVNQMAIPTTAEYRRWPQGPNALFTTFCRSLDQIAHMPFAWHEPDMFPTRSSWLDELTEEYRTCGQPFLGALSNSWMELSETQRVVVGKHLAGVACYSPDILSYAQNFIHRTEIAFDIAFSEEIGCPNLCAESKLIGHKWLTANYHWKDGLIHCTPAPSRIKGQEKYALATPMGIDQWALVHGCKDLSLVNLLREYHGMEVAA